MELILHSTCVCARGIKKFKCLKCGQEHTNFMNGIDVCRECCEKEDICQICGRKISDT